jgi:hypothetical protein
LGTSASIQRMSSANTFLLLSEVEGRTHLAGMQPEDGKLPWQERCSGTYTRP